ncbi:ubiquitin-related modifier 1 [Acaromyces ingoldii]|uniref:Ubiquitin-related modifier 1 n=1 Tax=Acaromyces ingoldii TaxID=215250 RepID=A0A316YGY4_9BASI|nr:ubiquitin-related modifier 1 [Acaromyces ingoldii]PWN88687.1 ubiquitin-related modifier 1 [Acaromyces ingoldii]
MSDSKLSVTVEFGGGTELLTATPKQKKHVVSLASSSEKAATMSNLLGLILKDLIVERPEMLVEGDGNVRPGILVLINDADWELEGEMAYEVQDGDHVCFISTLHGG